MPKESADLAVVGLGVMGRNLALNFADHDFTTAVYNRTASKSVELASQHAGLVPCETPEELAASLKRPRRVLMMLPAGEVTDQMIESLLPHLEPGDVLVDGGNTWFEDTRRREKRIAEQGIEYLGLGVSGGEVGARRGPSLMAGGSRAAWEAMKQPLEAVAARAPDGEVCAGYFGGDGAGHYIKMVHNGIEYAAMEVIAEIYWVLKNCNHFSDEHISRIFHDWNSRALHSYLLEISSVILAEHDGASGTPLLEMIRDNAQSKGTGIWCCQNALELGVPVPTIYAGIAMRQISEATPMREYATGRWAGQPTGTPIAPEAIEWAFYSSTVMAYAQGFALLGAASEQYGWGFDFAQIAGVWRAGCIIRAAMLGRIENAYRSEPELPTFAFSGDFSRDLTAAHSSWSRVVAQAATAGMPVAAMSSALGYFDLLRSPQLPANLLQAQRDYFGAHRFERTDRPRSLSFHHNWPEYQG